MARCARESLLGGLAGDAELGTDCCPGSAGLAGSGDCGGEGGLGRVGLLVRGGNPGQDVERGSVREADGCLSLPEGGSSGVAGSAQHDWAVTHGRGEGAHRPIGMVLGVVAASRGVNVSLTLVGHEARFTAGRMAAPDLLVVICSSRSVRAWISRWIAAGFSSA